MSNKLEPTNQSVFASMLQSATSSNSNSVAKAKGALISEIDEDLTSPTPDHAPSVPTTSSNSSANSVVQSEDGPSLMELMMQEQKRAAESKAQAQSKAQQEQAKQGFGGFKKGFFGASSSSSANPSSKSSVKPQSTPTSTAGKDKLREKKADDVTYVKAQKIKEAEKSFVFDEVQEALEEDQSNLLNQLKTQEWITPDLTQQFQSNKVLAKGFQDPKCLAAIQLMQQNPKEAMTRFKDDPDVNKFLQEFGKIMSKHFEALAATQSGPQTQPSSAPKIQEMGPLQTQALKSNSTNAKPVAAVSSSNAKSSTTKANEEDEEKRVQQILNDPELRTILMDSEFQKILMECGDPNKLRVHMQNPTIAEKIRKMQRAGLVKIEM